MPREQPNAKVLHVLTGPTAVGKTAVSLDWAIQNEAEIVSCDSLLFYRGMDIGTAKPTKAERERVTHHLIDTCDLTDRMDITRYVAAARVVIDGILQRGRRVLVTGGSGFYLRTFFRAVADNVEAPPGLREELEAKLQSAGLPALVDELRSLDPSGFQTIDLANPRRVLRAIERCRVTGKGLVDLVREFENAPAPFADFEIRTTRLEREPEDLHQRIEERIHVMLSAGLVAEVEALLKRGLRENPSACRAIGYREVIDMIDGRLSPSSLAETIARNTRGLVKKQRTWFRTQLPAHRVLPARAATVENLFDR